MRFIRASGGKEETNHRLQQKQSLPVSKESERESMAAIMLKRLIAGGGLRATAIRAYASIAAGSDIVSAAPNAKGDMQRAQTLIAGGNQTDHHMDLRKSIASQTDVSLSIARHVSSIEAKGSNLVFSPLSLHVVVSLIAAGAKGPTLEQLLSFLKSKSSDEVYALSSELVSVVLNDGSPLGGPKLSSANGLWVDQALPS